MSGWAYMLRCADGSYYVGSTSLDVWDRLGEHQDGRFKGYTASRLPVTLVWAEWCQDIKNAHTAERRIKGWRREKKQALIHRDFEKLKLLAKRAGTRRPSRLPRRECGGAPQGDALKDGQ